MAMAQSYWEARVQADGLETIHSAGIDQGDDPETFQSEATIQAHLQQREMQWTMGPWKKALRWQTMKQK